MPPRRDDRIRDQIDRELRRSYEDLLREPVPRRFIDLIDRLKAEQNRDDPPDTQD